MVGAAMKHVWILAAGGRWHVLRSANPADQISTLCLLALDSVPVLLSTMEPRHACPACKRELAAGTPGAVTTRDLRKPGAPAADAVEEW